MTNLPERSRVPEPYQPKPHRDDPTEWTPKDNSDYAEEQVTVTAEKMTSDPLTYGSLADHDKITSMDDLRAVEQTALANLRWVMNQHRIHPDERSLRVRWQLVVEGQGYRCPAGFIHPEAPEDIQRESQAAWKRCVEMATDSLVNMIFVRVWRRRQRALGRPREIES